MRVGEVDDLTNRLETVPGGEHRIGLDNKSTTRRLLHDPVVLNENEAAFATYGGKARRQWAIERRLAEVNNLPTSSAAREKFDIIGATGGLAAARFFNLFWSPAIGRLDGIDVGGFLEIRTRSGATYELLMPGFCARVGSKAVTLYAQAGGRMHKIGRWPKWTIEEARKKCQAMRHHRALSEEARS